MGVCAGVCVGGGVGVSGTVRVSQKNSGRVWPLLDLVVEVRAVGVCMYVCVYDVRLFFFATYTHTQKTHTHILFFLFLF